MSHCKNKVDWCLNKAKKELQEGKKHRGLIKINPETKLIEAHIKKAEHNLNAIQDFKKIGYSDWSASAGFYSIYHCFLAICIKFGYESRNQECTFALIHYLIETGQINLDAEVVNKIQSINPEESQEHPLIIDIRESEQYGVSLSLNEISFERLLITAKTILDKTKEIIQS